MTRLTTLALAVAFTATLTACNKNKQVQGDKLGKPPLLQPRANIYMRLSFDTDPSLYIGRFIKNGTHAPDEAAAMKTTCSEFVDYRVVDAGGTRRTELFEASREARLALGVPSLLGGEGELDYDRMVYVSYEETTKMIADVSDPAAFEACCKRAPDQCTDRYVGGFIAGTGAVYVAQGLDAGADAKFVVEGVPVETATKQGVKWQRAMEFDNPVYFALQVTDTWPEGESAGPALLADDCSWVDEVPKTSQGYYFVGFSELMMSERSAREAAMRDARVQAVRWGAEALVSGTHQATGTGGPDIQNLSSWMEEESNLEAASEGVASMVKDERWCVTQTDTPGGVRYEARVLAFLPNASADALVDQVALSARP